MKRYTKLVTGTDDYYVSALTEEQVSPFSPYRLITQRLAEYENTELEPKEIQLIMKAYDLMCDYYGSSIKEVISDKVGIKKSSGYLWDKFRKLAQEVIENDNTKNY